jgi:LCP family protein required for cell wall assembly
MVRSPAQTKARSDEDGAGRFPSASTTSPPAAPPLLRPPRWPRRILITLNIFVAICLLSVAGGYGYVQWKLGNLHRIRIGNHALLPEQNGPAMNVLLVGSDTRSTLSKADQKRFGTDRSVAGARTDTIMILHVDPNDKKAAILSLPRDLYVPIASGGQERINSAFDKGPENLIKTITQDFGIPIDHYIEVDFNGFRGIVQAVGEVNVYFPSPARDLYSNLVVKSAGCVAMNGDMALSYVRSRHYEYYEGGRWHQEGDGDLGRIQRQQDFIRRVLRKVKGVRDPLTLNRLIDTGIHNVTIDSGLSAGDILKLSRRFSSLSPETVDMETLPTYPKGVRIGGQMASVLVAKQPDAQQLIDRFTGKAAQAPAPATGVPAGVLPSQVSVRVLNGNGTSGQATKVATAIGPRGSGFNIAGTGDADSFRYIQSVITYGPGQLAKAQLLQAALVSPAQMKLNPALKGVDLTLAVGSDYRGVRPLPGQAAVSTTTSTPESTSTTVAGSNNATGKSPAASC